MINLKSSETKYARLCVYWIIICNNHVTNRILKTVKKTSKEKF